MFYGHSRSPSFYGERRHNSYSKSYSTDLNSLPPRNSSIQRVLNSDYGSLERSRSPLRDYSSPVSRLTGLTSSSLSGEASPIVRRREILDDRPSPASFINDDIGYSSKSRRYFGYSSPTTSFYTSYTPKTIKKPQRIDYSDYLKPVLSDRPMLKTGYVPRSREERDDDSAPIIRERKLIKFRETSDDVLNKIRRKISWDLPDEISSPLIDEMKEMNSAKKDEMGISDLACAESPLSGSPRPSFSSCEHGLDRSGISLTRKNSPSSNCLFSTRENSYDMDSKMDDLNVKMPIPSPRKKSAGSIPDVKRSRKSSIETLLSEEKSSNFSKIANEIRRSRESSRSADESASEIRRPSQVDDTSMLTGDGRKQLNANELSAINEASETNERGRRRRRREMSSENNTSEEKVPETRYRWRSRFRSQISNETPESQTPGNQKQLSENAIDDKTPHPISRMHRKSVKYKSDNSVSVPKIGDTTSESVVPAVLNVSIPPSSVNTRERSLFQEKSEPSEKKSRNLNVVPSKDSASVILKKNISLRTEPDKEKTITEKDSKSEFHRKQVPSETISPNAENKLPKISDKELKPEVRNDTGIKPGKTESDPNNCISNIGSRLETEKGGLGKGLKNVISKKEIEGKPTLAKKLTKEEKTNLSGDKKNAETKNLKCPEKTLITDAKKSAGDCMELESKAKEVKISEVKTLRDIQTKAADVKKLSEAQVNDPGNMSEKNTIKCKTSDIKASISGTVVAEIEIKKEKTSVDRNAIEVKTKTSDRQNNSIIVNSKPPSVDKKLAALETKNSVGMTIFSSISEVETKKEDVKTLLGKKSQLETEHPPVQIYLNNGSNTELRSAETSVDKQFDELKSKRPNLDKISKPAIQNTKILVDTKSVKSEIENSEVKKIVSNVSNIDIVGKNTKSMLEKKDGDPQTKIMKEKISSDDSKQETNILSYTKSTESKVLEVKSPEISSSKIEQKHDEKCYGTAEKQDVKNFAVKTKPKTDKKESIILSNMNEKGEHTKCEMPSVLDTKDGKTEIKGVLGNLVIGKKSTNLASSSQNQNAKPCGKAQENSTLAKEPEEIVVVCKLPIPKKPDLISAKKSIPVEQKVVVSIKNSALNNVDSTKCGDKLLSIAPKVQVIIPEKQTSNDSKSEECDKAGETPEINVTHTIVLKPKVQRESSDSHSQKLDKQEGKRLKSIPDVIKSTISTNAKTEDVSDIVKSTLTKGNDMLKSKTCLPNIKNNLTENGNIDSSAGIKTSASDGKLAVKTNLDFQKRDQTNSLIKEKDGFSNTTKGIIAKDRDKVNIKKSNSAVINSTTSKEIFRDKSIDKPDLIQMTTKSDKLDLPNVPEDPLAVKHVVDEIQISGGNSVLERDTSSSTDIKSLQSNKKGEENQKSVFNTLKQNISNSNTLENTERKSKAASQKWETIETESKSPEVKMSDIPVVKPEFEKNQTDSKGEKVHASEMTKINSASPKGIVKPKESDILEKKHSKIDSTATENNTKSIHKKLEINEADSSPIKTDLKKEVENLNKTDNSLGSSTDLFKAFSQKRESEKEKVTVESRTELKDAEVKISDIPKAKIESEKAHMDNKDEIVSATEVTNITPASRKNVLKTESNDSLEEKKAKINSGAVENKVKSTNQKIGINKSLSTDNKNYLGKETENLQERAIVPISNRNDVKLKDSTSSYKKSVTLPDVTDLSVESKSSLKENDSSVRNGQTKIMEAVTLSPSNIPGVLQEGKALANSTDASKHNLKTVPDSNRNDLKLKDSSSAYKKSVTLPNVTDLLVESKSSLKENDSSVRNGQNKIMEAVTLSSSNIPAVLQEGKASANSTDASKHNLKTAPDSLVDLCQTGKMHEKPKGEEIPFVSSSGETVKREESLQLPHINSINANDIPKRDFMLLKDCKPSEPDSSRIDNAGFSDKAEKAKVESKKDLSGRKSPIKRESTERDYKLSSDRKNTEENERRSHAFHTEELTEKSKIDLKTGIKFEEDCSQNTKDTSASDSKLNHIVNNILLETVDNKRIVEIDREKQKIEEKLKLPPVTDTKYAEMGQPEGKDSKENRREESLISRTGSTRNKIPAPEALSGKDHLENEKSQLKANVPSPESAKQYIQKASTVDSKNQVKVDSKNGQSQLTANGCEAQKQLFDAMKVNNESQPPEPKKTKELKLPPVPRPPRRLGLFLRPKDEPPIVFESSSDEESESETESESSEEEEATITPVVQKASNLQNGKSPDRDEKNRTRSEASNASIYSNFSNSTTCTTFSTSSLDDESGSPVRTQDKTRKLRFRKYEIDDFVFLKLLGKGSFGKVLLAELKDSQMYFAIKCLKKDVVLEDDDVESTMIERRVLALGTQHPYMCKLYCTFQSNSYLFFVMEYLNGGDLMFHIQESRRFEERRAMFYGAEIVSALKFLHKRGIVYRDIKLDNVMLDEQGHVRLVDFGMCQCRIYREECMPSHFCGTPTYIAPEIVMGQKYNQSVDWWSFGVLLYEMLTGRSPFHGTDEDELFWSICNEEPHYPRFLSKEAMHILGLLLVKAPSKRLGMPSCSAGDIKDHSFFSTIDWEKIESKQVPPPFKPSVSSPSDTRNFDSSFTMDSATLSPVDSEALESMDQEQFHGFSYTNPHITG